jgi:hypothetical protein
VVGCCEHGNELLGSIKWWEFIEWLSSCWLLKNDSDPFGELVMAIKQTMRWTVHLAPGSILRNVSNYLPACKASDLTREN